MKGYSMNEHRITIVGCGPGSLEYLTPLARQAIETAEVLVGARRLLDLFPAVQAERIPVGRDTEKLLDEIALRARKQRVAVLVTGDPGLCSLAQPVLRRFGINSCQVIPAVSSIQVAFARLGLDWLDARILSAHERDPDLDPASLKDTGKIAILAGREESLPWISRLIRSLGEEWLVFLCENLTLENERICHLPPPLTTGSDLQKDDVASATIVLLIRRDLLP